MLPEDLKRRLSQILEEEEGPAVDWSTVAAMSADLAAELGPSLPSVAASYLEGVEQRRSDAVLAHSQRSELLRYLRSSSADE